MTSSSTLKRRVINPDGNIGTFYNIYRDEVLDQSASIDKYEEIQSYKPVHCEFIDDSIEEFQNLLKWINIEGDLRVNILLKSELRTGVAALIDHQYKIDKYTRVMHYFCVYHERRILDNSTEAREHCKPIPNDLLATHIISAVSFGIDVVIVLQVPADDQTAERIDVALKKIQTQWKNSSDISHSIEDDVNILEKITLTKIYSNLIRITKMTSFIEICQFIDRNKQKINEYCPIEYTLQPIEWLYPDTISLYPPYLPLDKIYIDKFEKHLIEILNSYKQISDLLEYYSNQILPDYLKELLIEMESEYRSLQVLYESGILRLTTLMMEIHSGQANVDEIDPALEHYDQTIFKAYIQIILKKLMLIKEEIQYVNSSPQEKLKYNQFSETEINQHIMEQMLECQIATEKQSDDEIFSNDQVLDNK
ncbi:unnamed protein product [Rotaria sordida]|uniref:Uncharacterized protein n=1 Tax=Rotaria sordida TaxID=392033 RepID=A0A815U8M5_9BILA|nr:unnamed protein product [Rotaria sordida]